MTGGRPTWIPRGNETSATDRRHSRDTSSCSCRSPRDPAGTASPARRAGLAVNKHQGRKETVRAGHIRFAAGPPLHPSIVDAPPGPSTPLPGRHSCKLGRRPASWRPHSQAALQGARTPRVQMAVRYSGSCTGCPALMPLAIVCSSTVESRTPNGWREFFTIRRICGVGRPCRERANAASTARA